MQNNDIEKMLKDLAVKTSELAPEGLSDRIKEQIPSELKEYKGKFDTVRIIVDIKIGRLAAAVIIILMIIFCTDIYNRAEYGNTFLGDTKFLFSYIAGTSMPNPTGNLEPSESGVFSMGGREVFYCGDDKSGSKDAILMHWEIAEGQHRIVFADQSTKIVSGDELIELLSNALREK